MGEGGVVGVSIKDVGARAMQSGPPLRCRMEEEKWFFVAIGV